MAISLTAKHARPYTSPRARDCYFHLQLRTRSLDHSKLDNTGEASSTIAAPRRPALPTSSARPIVDRNLTTLLLHAKVKLHEANLPIAARSLHITQMQRKHAVSVVAGALSAATTLAFGAMMFASISGVYVEDHQPLDHSPTATLEAHSNSELDHLQLDHERSSKQALVPTGARSPVAGSLFAPEAVASDPVAVASDPIPVLATSNPVAIASDPVATGLGSGRVSDLATLSSAPSGLAPSGCPQLIIDQFGSNSQAACAIAFCESGYSASAEGSAGEDGWFQIHPVHQQQANSLFGVAFIDMHDPTVNVAMAMLISGGGSSWSAWSTRSVVSTGYCPNGTRAF